MLYTTEIATNYHVQVREAYFKIDWYMFSIVNMCPMVLICFHRMIFYT